MPTANDYLADATDQAAEALLTAFSLVPEDKLTWQAGPTNRSALDMVAECAILNGSTAAVVEAGQWVDVDFPAYVAEKEALVSRGKEATVALLKEAGIPFLFILTQAKANASITAQAAAALSHHGPVAETFIADRVPYAASMTDGRTAIELASKGPAALETAALWKNIKACLHANMKNQEKVRRHG